MKRTCKQCGKEFFLSQQEINFYKEKNLSIPKRCKDCRNANKTAKNAEGGDSDDINEASGNKKPDSVIQKDISKINKNNSADKTTDSNKSEKKESNKPAGKVKKTLYGAVAVVLLAGSAIFGNQYVNSTPAETTGYVTEAEVKFANTKLLNEHFEKHGKEMGYKTAEEYQRAAGKVVNNPDSLHKTESEDGDDVYYLEATNEFVIVSAETGCIRTYFYPSDGVEYFNRQ